MKPLLRSPYSGISVALTSLVVIMVLVGAYSSVTRVYRYSSSISSSIKWEVEVATPPPKQFYEKADKSTLMELTEIASRNVALAYEKLRKSGIVKDALVAQAINIQLVTGNYTYVSTSEALPLQPSVQQGISFLVIGGINTSGCLTLPPPINQGRNYTNVSVFGIPCKVANRNQIQRIYDLLTYGSSIEITQISLHATSTTTFGTGLNPLPYMIITNPSRAKALMDDLIRHFPNNFSGSLNPNKSRIRVAFSMVVALIDLKPSAYLNPASVSATYQALSNISEKLRNYLGFTYVSLPEAAKIQVFTQVELFIRFGLVFSLIIPLIAVFIAVPYTAESGVLAVRKTLGLTRLRGARNKVIKYWFIKSAIIFALVGYLLGIALLFLLSYLGGYSSVVYEVLGDPFFEGFTLAALAFTLGYLVYKSIRTSHKVSPTDAVKTQLTDEALLERMKVGWWGWFSIFFGLLFVFEGLSGWSAGKALTTVSSRSPGIGLLVGLVILFMLEASLRPFAPILLAYGFSKLTATYIDQLMEGLSKVFKGGVALAAKSITSLIKRRSVAITILLVFSVTLLAQSFTSAASLTSSLNTATEASVGAKYLGVKEVYVSNLSAIPQLASSYEKELRDNSSLIISFPAVIQLNRDSISRYSSVIVIPNLTGFLRNTYNYGGWGVESGFSNLITQLSEDHNTIIYSLGEKVNPSSIQVKSFAQGLIKLCEVNNIGHIKGFPGLPTAGLSNSYYEGVVIAGPWLLKLMSSPAFNKTGMMDVKLIVYTSSPSLADLLAQEGFRVTSLKKLTSSSQYMLFKDLTLSQTLPLITSLTILALSVAVAGVIAWSVSVESSRMYLLLRIRGVSKLSVLKIIITEWGVLALVSIGIGVLGGISLGITSGFSPINLGFNSGFLASALLGGVVDLSLASPATPLPFLQVGIASLIAWVIVALIPAIISIRIYSGSVRGRFIEVR